MQFGNQILYEDLSVSGHERGGVVGDFEPNVFRTKDFEVACKHYRADESETGHAHRIAIEITLIESGISQMNGHSLTSGDIVVLSPKESSELLAIEETTIIAIRVPSIVGDKYSGEF